MSKPKTNFYWTPETDARIMEYQQTSSSLFRNEIFNLYLYEPILKLTEYMLNKKHGQTYIETIGFQNAQNECVDFITNTILPKIDLSKNFNGTAFGYVTLCTDRFIIKRNIVEQQEQNRHISIDAPRENDDGDEYKDGAANILELSYEDYSDYDFQDFRLYLIQYLETKREQIVNTISKIKVVELEQNCNAVLSRIISLLSNNSFENEDVFYYGYSLLRKDPTIKEINSNAIRKTLNHIGQYYRQAKVAYDNGISDKPRLEIKTIRRISIDTNGIKTTTTVETVTTGSLATVKRSSEDFKRERREYSKKWYLENKEYRKEYSANYNRQYRAKKVTTIGEPLPTK